MEAQRVDKFLWTVRLFKTRSIATDECKKGRISINGDKVKASRTVKVGDILTVNRPPVIYSYEVIEMLKNRVGAKLVTDYIKDITPQEELNKLEEIKMSQVQYYRPKGTGRPTKRDRRLLDDVWE